MKTVTEVFSYFAGDYEWSQFVVYKHPRNARKFVVDSQSGCSCNYYELPSIADLEVEMPLTRTQVYAKFSEWFDGTWQDKADTKTAAIEKIRSAF